MITALIWLGLYVLVLSFSFLSEITYKKKTVGQVKEEAKGIVTKATVLFLVMLVSTYVYIYIWDRL